MNELITNLYFLDGGSEYIDILQAGGEPAVPLIDWILRGFQWKGLQVADTWKLNVQRDNSRTQYAHHWNKQSAAQQKPIDAILCAINPSAASPHDSTKYWGYSSVFNLLDYTAVVFPAGKVLASDTDWPSTEGYEFPEVGYSQINEEYRNAYTGPERYKDAPIGLQLVGRRYEEEKVLGILRRVIGARGEAGLSSKVEIPQLV